MNGAKESAFQFTNPLLMDLNFSMTREYTGFPDVDDIDIPIEMKVLKPNASECNDRMAFVVLAVKVGEKTAEFPYCITVQMGANFRWDESVDTEMAEALLSRNAPALLLGYIRPYIAQITEASPIGAIHVPFMNFNPPSTQE